MKFEKDGLTWETDEPAAIAAMINAGYTEVVEQTEEQTEKPRRGRKPKAEQAE